MTQESRATRTQGELEAAACTLINRVVCDMTGRGPRTISATLQGRRLIVFLEGILTRTDETLLKSSTGAEAGTDVVQTLRKQLMRGARSSLVAGLTTTFGQSPVGVLHDIAPDADEEAFVFRFLEEPRAAKRRA